MPAMSWNVALAALLSVALGAWMIFDGARALIVGDYFTPRTGRYAGSLGPWVGLVLRLGIDPRATPMKVLFVGFGVAWLLVGAGLVFGTAGILQIAIVLAFATLWYLPLGSAIALAVLLLVGASVFR
jgi:hypothetical protein